MFPYFGSKKRNAKRYPPPVYSTVIEPFCGSAAYSMHYRPEHVIANEIDERVFDLWNRLKYLEVVPEPPVLGDKTEDLLHKLMAYSEHSLTSTYLTVTKRMLRDWVSVHERIIRDAPYVRESFDLRLGTYLDLPDIEATWFIDPPYQKANRRGYLFGSSTINYSDLADWSRSRKGQVIVSEQLGADWLPFEPLYTLKSHRGSASTEVVWIHNHASVVKYDVAQQQKG